MSKKLVFFWWQVGLTNLVTLVIVVPMLVRNRALVGPLSRTLWRMNEMALVQALAVFAVIPLAVVAVVAFVRRSSHRSQTERGRR